MKKKLFLALLVAHYQTVQTSDDRLRNDIFQSTDYGVDDSFNEDDQDRYVETDPQIAETITKYSQPTQSEAAAQNIVADIKKAILSNKKNDPLDVIITKIMNLKTKDLKALTENNSSKELATLIPKIPGEGEEFIKATIEATRNYKEYTEGKRSNPKGLAKVWAAFKNIKNTGRYFRILFKLTTLKDGIALINEASTIKDFAVGVNAYEKSYYSSISEAGFAKWSTTKRLKIEDFLKKSSNQTTTLNELMRSGVIDEDTRENYAKKYSEVTESRNSGQNKPHEGSGDSKGTEDQKHSSTEHVIEWK